MNQREFLGGAIIVSAVFAFGGLGYVYVFGPLGLNLGPADIEQGIQLRPSTNCQEICDGGVFMGCWGSFQDLTCGLSCKGVISVGPTRGRSPIVGLTRCSFTECVCN